MTRPCLPCSSACNRLCRTLRYQPKAICAWCNWPRYWNGWHRAPSALRPWNRDRFRLELPAPCPGTGTSSKGCWGACAEPWPFSPWPVSGFCPPGPRGWGPCPFAAFAGRENPAASCLNFFKGIALSIPVAAFVGLGLLPAWDGFPLLCLGLAVPLFFASLCMSRPKLAPVASAFCIFFVNNVGPSNLMSYDLGAFLNKAMATLVGVGIAVVVLRLVSLNPGERHYRRMFKASLFDLAQLTSRPPEQAESWFGGRMADRLIRVSRYWQMQPENRRSHWDNGLLGLDLGDELLQLRGCLETALDALATEREHYLARLAALLRHGGPSVDRSDQLDAASAALLKALDADQHLPQQTREMARAAILQLQFTWRRWCCQQPAAQALQVPATG